MKASGQDFTDVRWTRYLSDERRAEAEKRKNERDRELFLAAEILLNRSLERLNVEIPIPAAYRRNPYGKPYLDLTEKFCANWSHSGEYVICAVSDGEIGIDLQYAGREPKESLIRKVLQPEELLYYETVPAEERTGLFYQYWTVKESYLKAIGTGFHTSLDTFYVRMGGEMPEIIQRKGGGKYACRLLDFADQEYAVSVCREGGSILEPTGIEYL